MKAPEIAGPSVAGCERFSSTWIRPITVPVMPSVGAKPPAFSGEFIATLLGVGTANIVYLPVGNRLKKLSCQEAAMRTMVLEGILAIQAGDNPRVVESKLLSYVAPEERAADGAAEGAPSGVAEPAAAAA
jgi:chemotaxis protein MotA